MGSLLKLLEKKTGSAGRAQDAIAEVAANLGGANVSAMEEQLAGLALCARGESIEVVSRHMTWKDFEGFCSQVLRAKGYRVRENIFLKKPRAQVDVLGVSDRTWLAIDCKHWARSPGPSALGRIVDNQKLRAVRLRDSLDRVAPIASVILLLFDPGVRFVNGGAIVPIHAFPDFLDNLETHRGSLEFV
jgi:hypothetical protein